MGSPISSSSGARSSNNQLFVSSYYNNPQMEFLGSIEGTNTNVTGPGDSFMRHYTSYQTNLQDSLLTGINLQENCIHENAMPLLQTRDRTFDQFTLQDIFKESLFPHPYNDVESSGLSSPSEDCVTHNMRLSENTSAPVSPAQTRNMEIKTEFTSGAPLITKKKHKRRQLMNRSRLGCWICRIKHLKCDESKPACRNCIRFGIECDYSVERPAYVLDTALRRQKLDAIITKKRRRSESMTTTSKLPSSAPENICQTDFSCFRKQEWLGFVADS